MPEDLLSFPQMLDNMILPPDTVFLSICKWEAQF